VNYRLRLSRDAERYFARLDRTAQKRVQDRLNELANDPFAPGVSKPLANAGHERSSRAGSLRILYFVERDEHVILVEEIGPRGQVYRRL